MSACSDDLAVKLLNATLRNTAYSSPATVYLAAYTTNPTAADSGSEVSTSGTAYARQALTFAAPSGASGSKSSATSAQVNFPIATADWGTVSHVGIRDDLTAGNLLYFGALSTARSIPSGYQLVFASGNLSVALS